MSNFISFRRCSNASTWDFKRRIMSRSVIAFPCTYNFRCGYRTQDDKCQCVRNTHQFLFRQMIGSHNLSQSHAYRQCRHLVVIVKIRVVTFIQVDHSATAPARLSGSPSRVIIPIPFGIAMPRRPPIPFLAFFQYASFLTHSW